MRDVTTVEALRCALQQVFREKGEYGNDWVENIARFIMDFFGYEDRILDNRLTPRDRDIFYMLEGVDILKTEMEEASIQKGKIWRIHYWVLNKERISELLKIGDMKKEGITENGVEDNIYANLSETYWKREGT